MTSGPRPVCRSWPRTLSYFEVTSCLIAGRVSRTEFCHRIAADRVFQSSAALWQDSSDGGARVCEDEAWSTVTDVR